MPPRLLLEFPLERLGENRLIDGSETEDWELKEGLMRLDDTDVKFINGRYTDSLWDTMHLLLPHYKTKK